VKLTALQSYRVRELLATADSMAWSFAARWDAHQTIRALQVELGRKVKPNEARKIMASRGVRVPDANDIREAITFAARILEPPREPEQYRLFAA
jgi:hypothetical protein